MQLRKMEYQALYRGEHYSIEKFRYEIKNKELGVGLKDSLLGLFRLGETSITLVLNIVIWLFLILIVMPSYLSILEI